MTGTIARAMLGGLLCCMLGACAGTPAPAPPPGDAIAALIEQRANPMTEAAPAPGMAQSPEQYVPYAREHSSVEIYGDAYTWWDQAAGRFARGTNPALGAVLVLAGYAGPDRGHVAVVREIISSREIRVDHANWLDDGSIYLNDPVIDVSVQGDWSAVRVWNIQTGNWGAKTYPVQGFIGPVAPAMDAHIASVSQ